MLGSVIELLAATMIWGFGFVATRVALGSFSPISMSVWRFGVAFVLGVVFLGAFQRKRALKNMGLNLRLALLPGFFLALTIGLQTQGLKFTSITNSGFLTTLYVPFVPIVEGLIYKKRPAWIQIFCVALALFGTALLCGFTGISTVNIGDVFTIGCALAATGHILTVGRVAGQVDDALPFNIVQTLFASLFSLAWIPLVHESITPIHSQVHPWLGLIYLSAISSLVAFTLQIKAQRRLSPLTASLIFLLESPFAAFFAWAFQNEQFLPSQIQGAAIIFAASAVAVLSEQRRASVS